jgi:hypothetical protein
MVKKLIAAPFYVFYFSDSTIVSKAGNSESTPILQPQENSK